MPVRVVRLGTPRAKHEGLRIGTVRRPPRGVKKTDYARHDYFDVWLPELAPSPELVTWALSQEWSPARWAAFSRRYRREMRQPSPARLLALLAAMSRTTDFCVGCYCADSAHCHRSVLRELLAQAGADMWAESGRRRAKSGKGQSRA